MVPAKTKRSGIHQYLPKKIHKWGFKNFVCAGASGIIYSFFLYVGQKSAGREKCGASEVALRLVEELPKTQNLQLFMDNWFSTLPLLCQSSKPREFYQLPPFAQIALDAHWCPKKIWKNVVMVRSTIGRTATLGHICWNGLTTSVLLLC